jgi:hypothetical protein
MTPNNLARSRRLVTALRKVCPEFRERRPEWWKYEHGSCPDCVLGGSDNIYSPDLCGDCGKQLPLVERLDPPDLLAPAHLAELWEVCRECDFLDEMISALCEAIHHRELPSEALMLVAEAALGCGEEVKHA